MAYTTVTKISEELNGFTLDASSTPTSTTVSSWIDEADAEIDARTGNVWSSNVESSEYYDYDGSGILRVTNTPIISVTELQTERNGIDATSSDWDTLYEGRLSTKDFIVYKDEGEIVFHGTQKPYAGNQNICVSYTYGYETTPYTIQRLSTLMVANRVINTIINGSGSEEGGAITVDVISISDPSSFSLNAIKSNKNKINDLINSVGSLKTYKTSRSY